MTQEYKHAAHGHLSDGKPAKHHKEAHIRKLESGHHVTKHHEDGSQTEHSAADIDEAMQHVQDHMNPEDEGEASPNPEDSAMQGPPAAGSPNA